MNTARLTMLWPMFNSTRCGTRCSRARFWQFNPCPALTCNPETVRLFCRRDEALNLNLPLTLLVEVLRVGSRVQLDEFRANLRRSLHLRRIGRDEEAHFNPRVGHSLPGLR